MLGKGNMSKMRVYLGCLTGCSAVWIVATAYKLGGQIAANLAITSIGFISCVGLILMYEIRNKK